MLIKRVPDTETRVKVGPSGDAIDETGVKFILNPYDEFAVEAALQLKERDGDGEVVVIALGADAGQETIRTALAMGADRGILLQTDTVPVDPVATGSVLAAELADQSFDLILCGKMAVDDYSHAVGTVVAERLGIASVSAVSQLSVADGRGEAEREIEGGVEVIEFELPAVITTDKGLNEPRYPALRGIMMAKKKPLEVKGVDLPASGMQVDELTLPPPRAEGRIVGEGPDAVPALIDALRSEAKVL